MSHYFSASEKQETHRHAAHDGGSNKVSVLVSFYFDVPPVQQQLGAFVHPALDQRLHPLLGLRGDQGAHVCAGLVTFKKDTFIIILKVLVIFSPQYNRLLPQTHT